MSIRRIYTPYGVITLLNRSIDMKLFWKLTFEEKLKLNVIYNKTQIKL